MAGPKVSAPLLQDLAPGDTTIQVPSGLAPDFADANKLYLSAGTSEDGETVTITARDEAAGTFTVTRGANPRTWYSHATTVQPSGASQGSPFMADDGSLPSTAPSVTGAGAIAIGHGAVASGDYAHAIGRDVTASAIGSHATGYNTLASGDYSTVEGMGAEATGFVAHAQGGSTLASGIYAHAEGMNTSAEAFSAHAEGLNSSATYAYAHVEGIGSKAHARGAHAEGSYCDATNDYSHAEGGGSIASGLNAHAEGYFTTASGDRSHAEGSNTYADITGAHAEGSGSSANGSSSHAEGQTTTASGYASHSEGEWAEAAGLAAHAGGKYSYAYQDASFARAGDKATYGKAAQELRQPMAMYTNSGTQADMNPAMRVGQYAGSVLGFKGQVAAVSKSGYAAHWEVSGLAHNFDGTGAVLASYTVNKLSYTGGGGNLGDNMALTLAASGYNVVAQVTGAASEYIQWAGYLAAANVYGSA